jgi:phosphoribosylamine-glycine ligase
MSLSQKSPSGVAVEKFLCDNSAHGPEIGSWLNAVISNNRTVENSKVLAYRTLTQAGVPMPVSTAFSNLDQLAQLTQRPFPYVVKFDTSYIFGLQTIVVRNETDLAQVFASSKLVKSTRGIVQDFCQGHEYTVMVLVGKHNWVSLGSAVDYKQISEHPHSANTFGMGSRSPCASLAPETMAVIDTVVHTLQSRFKFYGVLCCQFLQDTAGKLWFLEYNARFCDSETQSILPSLDPSACEVFEQLYQDKPLAPVHTNSVNAVTVCLVNQRWPEPQPEREPLVLGSNSFAIAPNHAPFELNYDLNTYWGSITNSGTQSHSELAQEIYDFLATQDLGSYRYRTDIGQ